jgi:L-alanine-DL-glutamate epimerase-like enolase superfamily enzyme
MADAYDLPFTPHDCTGPVNLALGVHLGVSQPNAAWQEVVRAYYRTWCGSLAILIVPTEQEVR